MSTRYLRISVCEGIIFALYRKRFVTMQHPQPQQSVHNRATLSTGLSQPSGSSHFLDPISFPNSHRYGGIQQQQQYGTTGSAPATATNRARNLRMVELPFYEHLHTIIEPTELRTPALILKGDLSSPTNSLFHLPPPLVPNTPLITFFTRT